MPGFADDWLSFIAEEESQASAAGSRRRARRY
jgi:hypothetical protein